MIIEKPVFVQKLSLTRCPACGREISTQAPSCPACGHPMNPTQNQAPKTNAQNTAANTPNTIWKHLITMVGVGWVGYVVAIFLLGFFFIATFGVISVAAFYFLR